ncbi:hypothetical protein PCL_12779 [Purpureocillium lilacinum]|uniref:Uncharacterized protein n=1 Tax=Purpureocillium lilacinum TaxID=33203 RepID=A0A2U3E793_PURLI|nr:hypothetical protein PCL_12779 [Purpureocillium lilacinum]
MTTFDLPRDTSAVRHLSPRVTQILYSPSFNGKADNDTVLVDADGVSRWATSGVRPLASQTAAVAIAITFKFRPEDAAAAAAAPRVINEVDAPEQVHESPPPDASVSVERSGGRA